MLCIDDRYWLSSVYEIAITIPCWSPMSRYLHHMSLRCCLVACLTTCFTLCDAAEVYAHNFTTSTLYSELEKMQSTALLVSDERGETLIAHKADISYVPASLVKVFTALVALDAWGPQYRFKTQIDYDATSRCMRIRGSGDPLLISEEIDRLVTQIQAKNIAVLNGIDTDSSFFSAHIDANGRGESWNPYDAPYAALAANFNSIALEVRAGEIISAEAHTPMTALAQEIGSQLEAGEHHVSLRNSAQSAVYFKQILSAKLASKGIQVGHSRCDEPTIHYSDWITYENSHTLQDVVVAMLKYSNNFIAQQLFLMLGAHSYQAPASVDKSIRVFDEYIRKYFGWRSYNLIEGAGLSRHNQLSARQIIDILNRFYPYKQLLVAQDQVILAKTGTMRGVRNYAGYVQRENSWLPFALIINQEVSYQYREHFTRNLQRHLNLPK